MIEYSKIKKGDTLRVLTTGLWGFTVANQTLLTVTEVDVARKRCEVVTPAGNRVYFLGDDPAWHFELVEKAEPDMSPIAQALQVEILELVGRNAKMGADLTAALDRIKTYEEVIEDHKRLVRELDVALHGTQWCASHASLCDLVAILKEHRRKHSLLDADPIIKWMEEAA